MNESNTRKAGDYKRYIEQRRSYFLGVFVGLSLIVINAYVGLFMLNLVLEDKQIVATGPGVSLPVIQLQNYDAVKKDILDRRDKDLIITFPKVDPYKTSR